MDAKHEPDDLYLSYLDVLEEEDEVLHGSPEEEVVARRQAKTVTMEKAKAWLKEHGQILEEEV